MTLLLYFTSFAAVAVLCASALAVAVWSVTHLVRTARGAYREWTDPEFRAEQQARRRPVHAAHLLKRAGQ